MGKCGDVLNFIRNEPKDSNKLLKHQYLLGSVFKGNDGCSILDSIAIILWMPPQYVLLESLGRRYMAV